MPSHPHFMRADIAQNDVIRAQGFAEIPKDLLGTHRSVIGVVMMLLELVLHFFAGLTLIVQIVVRNAFDLQVL